MMALRGFSKISRSLRCTLLTNYQVREKLYLQANICRCGISQSTRFMKHTQATQVNDGKLPNSYNKSAEAQTPIKPTSKVSSGELLEKLVTTLSADIHQKCRVYKNDFMRVLEKVQELNFSSPKQSLLLIRCCTELLPDESPTTRMTLVQQVWTTIQPHTKFTVDHYNELLRVYIANKRSLTAKSFIQQMAPVVPDLTTYELILQALGEAGDLNQSTEVIANMKSINLPATENMFNSLIVSQGKNGTLKNIPEVLSMMKSLRIEPSVNTYVALARAYAINKQNDQLMQEMDNGYPHRFEERHIMGIVKTLSSVNNYEPVPKVLKYLPESTLKSPSISPFMQSVTTQLVFENHPMVALEIYKCLPLPSFGPKDDRGLHGRSLVRDCVKANVPSSGIAFITQELMASGRNPIALQNASEAALQQGKVPLAVDLFTRMKMLGMPLRPHYFWPIMLHSSKTCGEKGIMNTLQTMLLMEVDPDYETMMKYVLPHVSFTSPQNLMKKFQAVGMSVGMVLTPMMETLVKTGQVRAASELCELFHGKVEADKLIKPLINGYLTSLDLVSTVDVLQDICKMTTDKEKDWVGRFLCAFVQHSKTKTDLSDFLEIVKAIQTAGLRISSSAADYCLGHIPELIDDAKKEVLKTSILDITNDTLVDEGIMHGAQMPHPKNMSEEALRAHLVELEAKGLNTRGVLRKLLQLYCRSGNLNAAREIVGKCQKEGVFLSAGMKAAIFDMHVKLGEIDMAESILADLTKSSPNFMLDEFKVIDFATLMVYRGKIKRAFDLIVEQSKKRKIIGGRTIATNCWRLLDATAAQGTLADTRKMFETMVSLRYCEPSNVLLGPLVRAQLKTDNLEATVKEFTRIADKYSKTPLKHELLCRILKEMSDGMNEENFIVNEQTNGRLNKLAHTILNINRRIHGPGDVQLTLVAALADVGYKKTLRRTLLDTKVRLHPDAILRRCERFAGEANVAALQSMAEAVKDLRHVDARDIYDMILDVFQRSDDCTKALKLWDTMQETDVSPSSKFVKNYCAMMLKNNKPVPPELLMLQKKMPIEMPKEEKQVKKGKEVAKRR